MPLFISDEEYDRYSNDPSVITQKADAFIKDLYNQLHTQQALSIDKDREIERLSLQVAELQKSKSQLLQLIEQRDLESNKKNSSIKGHLDKIVALTDTASSKQQISEETSAQVQFEPGVIQIVHNTIQFNGLPDEDPYGHIASFLEICDFFEFCNTFKINDAIKLRLFTFSLRDKAKLWLRSLPVDSITTWDTMAEKFVSKYFPPSKAGKLRNDIYSFRQDDEESLYETWERFKDLLRRCPEHRIPLWSQVEIFWNGLFVETRRVLDTAAGGSLINKTAEAAYDLIENMAMCITDKPSTQGVHEIDAIISLTAKLKALNHKIDQMQVIVLPVSCELCRGPHASRDCQHRNMFLFGSHEQDDYMGNQVRPQNNSYNNPNDPSWRNRLDSSWQSSSIHQLPTGFQHDQQDEHQNQQYQYN